MKIFLPLFVFLTVALLPNMATAQSDCSNGRYINRSFFDSVTVDTGIIYGKNLEAYGSDTQILEMDVYQPYNDTLPLRPVIIWAFGGSFVAGDRETMSYLCDSFAKLGYVTATIDYRYSADLFFYEGVDAEICTEEVIRAEQDMKAAVRYFKRMAAIDSNYYRVDTNYIIIGGESAGAITADQAGYLTPSTPIPPALTTQDSISIGGTEGYSGSQGYSSKVAGIISYSGLIGDTSWIQPGGTPIFMVHDSMDPIVPFGTDTVYLEGVNTGVIGSGDGAINTYLNRIGGVPHQILTYNNGWHVDYITIPGDGQFDSVIDLTRLFLADSVVCAPKITSGIQAPPSAGFNIFPNPVTTFFQVQTSLPTAYNLTLSNMLGQVILNRNSVIGNYQVNTSGLATGIYVVQLYDSANKQPIHATKVVIGQ